MFNYCSSLIALSNISEWDIKNNEMFYFHDDNSAQKINLF